MTLILTLRTDKMVVQASDRRLKWTDGRVKDDDANKAIVAYCKDARFSLAYTGLAEIEGQRTDVWLCYLLGKMQLSSLAFSTVCDRIKEAIEQGLEKSKYKRNPSALTVVCAGYEVRFNAKINHLVNRSFVSPIYVPHDHTLEIYRDRHQIILAHGWIPAINISLKRRIQKMAKRHFFLNRSEILIANEFVSFIRAASNTPKEGEWIGRNCMSVISTASIAQFQTNYHPATNRTEHYFPHIVFSNDLCAMNMHIRPMV